MAKNKKKGGKKQSAKIGFASITAQDNFDVDIKLNPHSSPIFATSTWVYESAEKAQQVFKGEEKAFIYSRWSHPNAEMVERRMQNFLPRNERYRIKYKSLYRVHQRVAKDFRVGRVLLAGDAAHLNNPMGAFGLNGGIHDSFNLTEKLAKVCRGEADESLLELYVRQRRTVNLEYVQEHSIKNLRRLNEKSETERRRNFDELRKQAASREGRREFLLVSSMIASMRRANAIT